MINSNKDRQRAQVWSREYSSSRQPTHTHIHAQLLVLLCAHSLREFQIVLYFAWIILVSTELSKIPNRSRNSKKKKTNVELRSLGSQNEAHFLLWYLCWFYNNMQISNKPTRSKHTYNFLVNLIAYAYAHPSCVGGLPLTPRNCTTYFSGILFHILICMH